jgi:hypothetical protein
VFGEWIFVFIIYIFVEIQPHFLDNVDRLFEVESNYYINWYVIVKNPQDEPSGYCMTFAYVYNQCLTLIILILNCMVSSHNFFIVSVFESYIVQCKSSVDVCIWTKI